MATLGYSADIDLRLVRNGESIDVAKTGPDRITLTEPRELSAGPAELIITIDGHETVHPVVLQATTGPTRIVFYW